MNALESFHHRVAWSICRMPFRYFPEEDRWERPPTGAVLERASLFPMEHYVRQRQQYLITHARERPLYRECMDLGSTASSAGSSGRKRYWWDQPSLREPRSQNGAFSDSGSHPDGSDSSELE